MVTEVKLIIAGVILAALTAGFFMYRHSLIVDGEQKIAAAVSATTLKLEMKRRDELTAQAKVDADNLTLVEKTYANALVASYQSTDDLNRRLRAYAAASRSSAAVPGDPATPAGPDVPAAEPSRVERAVEGVNRAAGHDGAQVIGLQQYIQKECH